MTEQTNTNVHPVIYTKEHCPQCMMTQKWFKQNNVSFVDNYYGNVEETNELDISSDNEAKRKWSEQKIAKLKDKYLISALPFVKIVDEDGELKDYWTGFRPDKMAQWFKK